MPSKKFSKKDRSSVIKEELKRVKKYFYEEILRKDEMISDIKVKNATLLATAVRQSKRIDGMNQKLIELEKKLLPRK
jgi:hypothetical protein